MKSLHVHELSSILNCDFCAKMVNKFEVNQKACFVHLILLSMNYCFQKMNNTYKQKNDVHSQLTNLWMNVNYPSKTIGLKKDTQVNNIDKAQLRRRFQLRLS